MVFLFMTEGIWQGIVRQKYCEAKVMCLLEKFIVVLRTLMM